MNLKCKKCGSDLLTKDGEWYRCLNCGAVMFDTDLDLSATKAIDQLDKSGDSDFDFSESKGTIDFSIDKSEKEEQDILDFSEVEDDVIADEKFAEVPQDYENKVSVSNDLNAENEIIITPDIDDENDKKTKKKKKKEMKKNKDNVVKQTSVFKEIIDFITPIICAIIIAVLLKTFVFANCVVPTGSMLNTIQEKDRIIASRLAYINDDPERYDIIVFKYPDDESQNFVKRVIGLPGETVEVVEGVVYVTQTDGKTIKLDQSFVTNCTPTGNYGPYKVPEDSYFVMGDNRNNSWDSRFWDNKYVKKDKIIGKVKFRYYPSIGKVE